MLVPRLSQSHYESLPSEPPDISNWFSSYVYESPVLDTSDGLELSIVPGESECVKETEFEKETTEIDVCPKLFEQELVSSTMVTDLSQSQALLSEPPDVRNWFSSYEYESPQISDTQEFGFSSFEEDRLIIDESDTEDENSHGIFRKTKSKQETIVLGRLNSSDYKENIAADKAKEISSDNACSDQEMEKKLSVGLFNASNKEVKQESSVKQKQLFSEPKEEAKLSPIVSRYSQKRKSPSKIEASTHELRPKHIQETIFMNSNRQKSPIHQESDDKENVHGQGIETGFVTMKKARFREARDQCSMAKRDSKLLDGGEDKEEEKSFGGNVKSPVLWSRRGDSRKMALPTKEQREYSSTIDAAST